MILPLISHVSTSYYELVTVQGLKKIFTHLYITLNYGKDFSPYYLFENSWPAYGETEAMLQGY